jgi:hypothetical protein
VPEKLLVAALSVAATLVLGACYGATEPASVVGEDGATLRGQGTANNGPASSYFEYWTGGDPLPGHARPRTPTRSWPAGASGPFSERVSDLLVASSYSFRLCGADQGSTPVCAQTRSFTTPTPAGDYVTGSFAGSAPPVGIAYTVRFNARSGPTGQNARGTVKVTAAGQTRTDTVACLIVGDVFATIGVVRDDGSTLLYRIEAAPEEPAGWATSATSKPPNCATGTFQGVPSTQSSFVLHDEP